MATVNVNDRSSLERVYPEDAFANDGAQNERMPNELWRGGLIASAPDNSGCFEFDRATRHSPHFLAPTRRAEEVIKEGDHHSPRQVAPPRPPAGYSQFLDDIVETARRVGSGADHSPGYGETQVKGISAISCARRERPLMILALIVSAPATSAAGSAGAHFAKPAPYRLTTPR
jgi:hypothetical protein